MKPPPLLILWKAQVRAALEEPRVDDRKKLMSNTDTRGSIIVGVCQRDPERWREFDAIYRPMLFAFLRKQHLNESDAEEVVQDIFVRLLDKIHTYDRERVRFRSWLFAVAHNSLVDKARRRASFKRPSTVGSPRCSAQQSRTARSWPKTGSNTIARRSWPTR